MDSAKNWKKILLQWVIKCNLVETNVYSLDQTEVEAFFMKFKDSFKEEYICQYKNLSDFLKEEYPLFEPHFDDENTLSSSDYIYVYSLLLHFSCVKVSNAFFQENCKKLDDFAQRNITTFFEKLLNEESLTKETLRRVIASTYVFTPPNTRIMYAAESPMKTPRKMTDISPPTPRSCMLIEKNKKVNILSAQLDYLNYEKSSLETDLKSYQDKIDKLKNELKRSNQEVQDLKNEILSKNMENNDCGTRQHSGEEKIRKLNKKIAQKEEEIAQQRDTIEDLTGEKNILSEKLKKSEQQIKHLQENINTLAQQVDDYSQELEQKDIQIQNLSETKDELEQFIKELRSSTVHSGPDLNMSSEFLDLSRVTNSSGSLHSPENLGSVVDIKLREKESENLKLLEEITSIRIDNSKLAKAMSQLTERYSKLFDVCHDNLILNNNDADEENPTTDSPANCFIIFSNYMQTFASKYEENCFELKRIKENERKTEEKLEETQNQNVELEKELDELKAANKALQLSKTNLERAVAQLENKLDNCLKERSEEANNLKNLRKELESLKIEKQDAENQVVYLTTCLDTKEDILTKLQSDNDEKTEILNENRQKLKELAEENKNLEEKLNESEILEKDLREQLDYEKSQRIDFEEETQRLSIELERSHDDFVIVLNEKNYLRTLAEGNQKQIDVLKQKIRTLTDDQSHKAAVISKLETDKQSLIGSMQEKVDNFSKVIDKYEEGFELKAKELNELTAKWRLVEAECNSKQDKLQDVSQQLERTTEAFHKVTQYIGQHVNNLKCRLGINDNSNSSNQLDLDDIDSGFKKEATSLVEGILEVSDYVRAEDQKLAELQKSVERLNEINSSLEAISETNKETMARNEALLKQQTSVMNSTIEKLQNDLRDKTIEAEMLSEKQTKAEELIVQLEFDSKVAREKLEDFEKELKTTKSELDKESTEKKAVQEELQNTVNLKNQLQSEISSLETQLAEMREEACRNSDKITRLQNEITEKTEELQSIILQLETETVAKMNITHQLESERVEKENLNREMIEIKIQLEEQVSESKSTKLQLEKEITEKHSIIEELKNKKIEFKNIASEAAKISKELQHVKEEKEQIKKTVVQMRNEFENELKNIKLQSETLSSHTMIVNEELESVKLRLETETTEKHTLQSQFESLQTEKIVEIQQISLQLESEVARTKTLTEELESVKDEFNSKNQLLKELEETKSHLESEVQQLNKLNEEFAIVKLDLENEIKENQNLIEKIQKEKNDQVQTISAQLNGEVEKTTTLTEELENAKDEVKKNNEVMKKLENEVKTLISELESETIEKSKFKNDFESTKIRLDFEVTEKMKIHESLKESQTQNDKMKEELESVKIELESKVAENLLLQKDLESKHVETSKVKEALAKANKNLEDLESKITLLETQFEETKHQLDQESASKNEMKNKLEISTQELDEHRTTILNLEAEKEALNQRVDQFKKQLDDLNVQLKNETAEKCQLAEALASAKKQISDLSDQKVNLELKNQDLSRQSEEHKTLLQSTDTEVKRLQNEESRLLQEIETLKTTHDTQIQKCNREIDEQKENVFRLIQEIASIRKEKEFAEEEKRILSNRLESKVNEQKSKETTQRSIQEKLQSAEKEVLVKLNLLKTEQLKSQDLENQLKKLQLETVKLRESAESYTKRMEKQAWSLGESQAQCQKFKKEADAAQISMENLKSLAENTQRDNCRLNQECRTLKDKLTKSEKTRDQLESKIQTLQKSYDTLVEENKIIENSENDLKISKSSLEKIKLNLEDKIRKLAKALSDANVGLSKVEQDKVQLNLEIGGLNKQLQENKTLLNMKLIEVEDLTSKLIEAKSTNEQLLELNEKHQLQAREIHDENSRLNDQLSKLTLRLEITQKEHETARSELEQLKNEVEVSKSEKDAIEKDHRTAIERLMGVEERRAAEIDWSSKIKSLEAQITKLTIEKCDIDELRSQDRQIIDQLNKDISVFTAKLQKSRGICEENEKKWADEKEQLLAEVRGSEERIKETRFELEGKLEKMKNKMKTLYNDEVAKMKKKQEREIAVYKMDIDSLKAKNEKHEEHIKKLSSQLFRLNENLLEFQKENTFLKTKLKDVENKPRQISRLRPKSVPSSAHQVLSSNLRMEDEEGEIFNNTYLSDLKDGRMSEYFNTDVCAQELQYRNSLVPPHLKSTYLAQFDHQMGEEEIRDIPTLDDSSSTLLNTGQRKKVSGATSYKRPGPPTPSKNAGRLSFGGIGELHREILKESHDSASCSSSSSKTPAKFKFFSSKLSMKGDERKSVLTNFKRKHQSGAGGGGGPIQCSSTPRKSKAHIDQRRLLDQIMSTASPGPNYSPADAIVKPVLNLLPSLKSLESTRRISAFNKWRQPRLSIASDSGNSDVNSPRLSGVRYAVVGSSGGSSKRRPTAKRAKDRRGSIYLRGTMFARSCRTPTNGTRDFFKSKAKIHRTANFNKYRQQVLNQRESLCTNNWDEDEDNNNNDDDFFMEEINRKTHAMHTNGFNDDDVDGEENFNSNKTSKHFQQLLEAKESHAPFEISAINSNQSFSNVNNSSSNVHSSSRTIYGASVIINRKIPHINTTMVRKSSIYVKGSDGKSVILVTNQTITLKDLAAMWFQMNFSTRSVIALSLTATLIGVISFAFQFMNR